MAVGDLELEVRMRDRGVPVVGPVLLRELGRLTAMSAPHIALFLFHAQSAPSGFSYPFVAGMTHATFFAAMRLR